MTLWCDGCAYSKSLTPHRKQALRAKDAARQYSAVADLMAERSREAVELDHARRGFVLDCRAASIEPIDAPYTFTDAEGAAQEARYVRRLGYRAKGLVRPSHAMAILWRAG